MGIARRVCSENKIEMRSIKGKIQRIVKIREKYPNLTLERKMQFAVTLNDMFERLKYLKMNKLNSQSPEWDYTIVYKKDRVKNRLA